MTIDRNAEAIAKDLVAEAKKHLPLEFEFMAKKFATDTANRLINEHNLLMQYDITHIHDGDRQRRFWQSVNREIEML